MNLPGVVPQHQLVSEMRGGKAVPELMINNIAVFAQMYVTYNYCTAAYTIVMAVVLYVEKTWVQKNEY